MTTGSSELSLMVRQLRTIAEIDERDEAVLAALPFRTRDIPENRDVVREGDRPTECCLVLQGLVARYKLVADGRRQILSFHFPGDLPDMQGLNLDVMDHSLTALTPARVAYIPHESIRRIMATHTRVRHALIKYALIDGAIYREWIANVGRRTALERVAHTFCECYVRMRALGLVKDGEFDLPLTQSELGDATGISNVHVNRTLQEMRRMNLISTSGNHHSILDWPLLRETADFRPDYLHLRPEYRFD